MQLQGLCWLFLVSLFLWFLSTKRFACSRRNPTTANMHSLASPVQPHLSDTTCLFTLHPTRRRQDRCILRVHDKKSMALGQVCLNPLRAFHSLCRIDAQLDELTLPVTDCSAQSAHPIICLKFEGGVPRRHSSLTTSRRG